MTAADVDMTAAAAPAAPPAAAEAVEAPKIEVPPPAAEAEVPPSTPAAQPEADVDMTAAAAAAATAPPAVEAAAPPTAEAEKGSSAKPTEAEAASTGAPVGDAATPDATGSPQKPKRAVSAYWLYSNEMRDEISKAQKEKNGGKAKLGDIAKEVGARWAALPEAEKKVYEDKVAADKQRYASELKVYMEASDPAGTLRQKYQHMIPKKPLTAYFLFNQEPAMREKATEALKAAGKEPGNKQVASKLGEMWKAAAAEEKAPFEEQHKKEQAEFLERQKAWQATPEFAEIEKAEKAQEERRKATEAEQQGAEAKEKAEKEAKSTKKRSRSSAAKESTPTKAGGAKESTPKAKGAKETKTQQSTPASDSKRAKKATTSELAAPQIDTDVLAEAAKLGYESVLKNLSARPDVLASGKNSRALLEALTASNGLVNPAKRALLGA